MKQRRFAVVPDVLIWARHSAHLASAEAARRIGVSEARVEQWERGEVEPTINQLLHAAEAYNRPLAALFLPTPLQEEDVFELPDFRRPEAEGEESAPLRRAILRAQRQQEALRDIRDELDDVALPPLRIIEIDRNDAEHAGVQLSNDLGFVDLPKRMWSQPEELLRELVRRVEERGYLVIQVQRVPVSEMRGFSIAAELAPLIAINGADWPRGKYSPCCTSLLTLVYDIADCAILVVSRLFLKRGSATR